MRQLPFLRSFFLNFLSICVGVALSTVGSAAVATGEPFDLHTPTSATAEHTTEAGEINDVVIQCSGQDDTEAVADAIKSAGGRTLVIANGQTCAVGNLTIPNLRIEPGAMLRPLTSQTVVLATLGAGNSQVFDDALPGGGRIAFTSQNPTVQPDWWTANRVPGTTDMTSAIQAAITATRGRGRIFFPQNSYLITDSLTIPSWSASGSQSFSPIVFEGEGPFLSNLINKAPRNKPTLLINRDLVVVRNLGFWGDNAFPNDGIKVSLAGRIYIESNEFFVKGNAIFLEQAQSVWIRNNFGSVSAGSTLPPTGVTSRLNSLASPTDSFVYVNIPDRNGYVHHLIVRDNMNEGYFYQVYTNNPAHAINLSWQITGNQFESSAHGGLKLDSVQSFEISSNYLSEGGGGYAIDLNNCRNGRVGPNYIHTRSTSNVDIDDEVSAVRIVESVSITLLGAMTRLYLKGACRGIVGEGTFIDRLQDETNAHQFTLINSVISDISVPTGTLNIASGQATWYAGTSEITAYPTARSGDKIINPDAGAGSAAGWVCTTASSAGRLTRLTGSGPEPLVLDDYAAPVAYDFRITVLTGGNTGTATYKVEWKPQRGGAYADLTNPTRTTELAHLIKREKEGGPLVSFSLSWPAARAYSARDSWELRGVVAPMWTIMSSR